MPGLELACICDDQVDEDEELLWCIMYDNDGVNDDLGVGVVAGGSMQVNPSLSNMRPI